MKSTLLKLANTLFIAVWGLLWVFQVPFMLVRERFGVSGHRADVSATGMGKPAQGSHCEIHKASLAPKALGRSCRRALAAIDPIGIVAP